MGRLSALQTLPDLFQAAGLERPEGLDSIPVRGLRLDSRQVQVGDCFLALRGNKLDGMSFASDAIQRGAAVVVTEEKPGSLKGSINVPIVVEPRLRSFVGPMFDAWNGFPSRHLSAFGVTGTNGKSTTTFLISAILKAAGHKVISLGTLRYEVDDEAIDSNLTTPSPDVFFSLLARGVQKGCDVLAMEVSSHALSQDRVKGVLFKRAIFTNLTQDHLDFHSGFEDYFAAKKKLFTEYMTPDGIGIINLDTPYGVRLMKEWKGECLTFSRGETAEGKKADLVLKHQSLSLAGSQLKLAYKGEEFEIGSKLIGNLNVENLLAATAFGLSLDLSPEIIAKGISEVTVPGRNEVFPLPATDGFAVVDYAHTPDALERVLLSLRPLTLGKLWCVFGCGGDRDRSKRPLMGAIAESTADRVILTSDNPRGESPSEILTEIRNGMRNPENAEVVEDRRDAIRKALQGLGSGDCLLVAGKGHEDYQIVGTERRHFSDQEEITAWIRERSSWN